MYEKVCKRIELSMYIYIYIYIYKILKNYIYIYIYMCVTILVCGVGTWRVKSKKLSGQIWLPRSVKLKFLEKNFWQWPEMRIKRCWQVVKINLFKSTSGNWGRKILLLKWFPSLGKVKINYLTVKRFGYDVTYTPVKRWDSEANKGIFFDGKKAIWHLMRTLQQMSWGDFPELLIGAERELLTSLGWRPALSLTQVWNQFHQKGWNLQLDVISSKMKGTVLVGGKLSSCIHHHEGSERNNFVEEVEKGLDPFWW